MTDEQRRSILDQLYFEGDNRAPFLKRFSTLLTFSVVIAVFGIANDSAPVVIGAMLLSPLTTPLLGLAAALVMGWPRRQAESLLILAGATAFVFALAYGLLELIPEPRAITIQSEELLERTEPRLLDLGVAVVAGAAGAYVLVRREAVGALPGVAMAVTLVPPVAAVGMLVELNETDLASGALLLYVTNLVGIVFAASLVLLAAGMKPVTRDGKLPRRAKVGLLTALAFVIAIALPLSEVTERGLKAATERDDAEVIAQEWVESKELRITEIITSDDHVEIDVSGPRPPETTAKLADDLAEKFGRDIEVTVGWTRERRIEETGASAVGD